MLQTLPCEVIARGTPAILGCTSTQLLTAVEACPHNPNGLATIAPKLIFGVAIIAGLTHGLSVAGAEGWDSATGRLDRLVVSGGTAVAEPNAKAGYAGGWMNSAEGHNFDASVSLPFGDAFGLQADALYSHIGSLDFYGGAGHLFWRDPTRVLVGVTGGYLTRTGVDTFQIGMEAECYLDRITFGVFAGLGQISYARPAPFIDTEPTRFVGSFRADWYPTDELRVGACYMHAFDNNLLKGEIEYQTPVAGLALTAEGALGDNDYDHVLLGVRYYFGGSASTLRERHRRLDPPSLMPQILHGLGLYGAEYNHRAQAYFRSHYGLTIICSDYGLECNMALTDAFNRLQLNQNSPPIDLTRLLLPGVQDSTLLNHEPRSYHDYYRQSGSGVSIGIPTRGN